MPSLRKEFGNHLRGIRLDRKLSQERFAERVGISVDFLSLIERGVNAPSFETIEQMAKSLRLRSRRCSISRRKGRSKCRLRAIYFPKISFSLDFAICAVGLLAAHRRS